MAVLGGVRVDRHAADGIAHAALRRSGVAMVVPVMIVCH
jgi:hypothetical protein